MDYEKTIKINKNQLDTVKSLMVEPKSPEMQIPSLPQELLSAKFDNNLMMVLVLDGNEFAENKDNSPWIYPALYDDQYELTTGNPEPDFDTDWTIEYQDDVYTLHIDIQN